MKNFENFLNIIRENIKLKSDLLMVLIKVRKLWSDIFKMLKGNKNSRKIIVMIKFLVLKFICFENIFWE